jgi:hypothetical protein
MPRPWAARRGVFPLHYPVDGQCSCGDVACTNPSFTGAASIRIPTRHASYQRQRRWKSSISRGDFSVHDFLTSGVARHKGGIGLPRLGRPHQSAPTAPGGRGDDGPQPGLHGVDRDGAGRLEDRAHDAALGGGHGSDAPRRGRGRPWRGASSVGSGRAGRQRSMATCREVRAVVYAGVPLPTLGSASRTEGRDAVSVARAFRTAGAGAA